MTPQLLLESDLNPMSYARGIRTVVPTTFRFPGHLVPSARTVSVVGSFNGWNSTAHPLRRVHDDEWTITVYLAPGRVVYMFCVDGVMWLDPLDEGRIPNGWGSEYSIRQVTSDITADAGPTAARPTLRS